MTATNRTRPTKLEDVQRRVRVLIARRLDGPLLAREETELRDLYRRERQLLGLIFV